MQNLLQIPIIILISGTIGIFIGFVIGMVNRNKTVEDYKQKDWVKHIISLAPIYPSSEESVFSISEKCRKDCDGDHTYILKKCVGYLKGETKYEDDVIEIEFVKKYPDGVVIPGVQNEQLITLLIDRTNKLNKQYPSEENETIILSLQNALNAHRKKSLWN